jgi:transcriptional regulator with XRE-family HTH domain
MQEIHMSSTKSLLINKIPHLQAILDRFKLEMSKQGDTQRSLAAKIPCHAGQLSKSLAGNSLPSANILIGAAREGYDMNYILRGKSADKRILDLETELRDANTLIDSLERILKK